MSILRKFAETILVRRNEYRQVVYFFTIYLLAGCGNTFGRSSTDALFFKRFGIDHLPVMYILLGVSLSALSIFYAAFADRIKPERFFTVLYSILIVLLLGNWAVISFSTSEYVYPVYFLVYEIASEIYLIHVAFYIGQNFDILQAKRLFPVIMSGALFGSIIGGTIISQVSSIIGIQNIILLWCLLLCISIVLISSWHKSQGSSPYYRPQYTSSKKFTQAVSQITSGIKLLGSSKLLRFSSISLYFMVITFYVLCYSVNRLYTTTFTSEEELTAFYGKLTAATSMLALLIQIFITNKVIHKYGAKKVNLFFPVTSIFSYIGLLSSYTLSTAVLGSINKDSIMPALRNPVRSILFNALPENVRGRALSTQVVIVLPLALATCGTLLLFMQKQGDPAYFLLIGLCSAFFYLFFNHKMNGAYISEMLANLKKHVYIDEAGTNSRNHTTTQNIDILTTKINSLRSEHIVSFIKLLLQTNPRIATEIILSNKLQLSPATRDVITCMIASTNPQGLSKYLWESYSSADFRLKFTILETLYNTADRSAEDMTRDLLSDNSYHLQAAGIAGTLLTNNTSLLDTAINNWKSIITSEDSDDYFLSLKLIRYIDRLPVRKDEIISLYKTSILKMCNQHAGTFRTESVFSLKNWPENKFNEILPLLESEYFTGTSESRIACLELCRLLDNPMDNSMISQAMDDMDPCVQNVATKLVYEQTDNADAIFSQMIIDTRDISVQRQYALLKHLIDSKASPELIDRIANSKCHDALKLTEILALLSCSGSTSAKMQITLYAIEERIHDYIDLTLLALQNKEHPESISIVRQGLKSKDPRHIANATEIISNMQNREIIEMLSILVDKKEYRINVCSISSGAKDSLQALNWCASHNDSWIRYCAQNVIADQCKL